MDSRKHLEIKKIFLNAVGLKNDEMISFVESMSDDKEVISTVLDLLDTYKQNSDPTIDFSDDIAENILSSPILFPSDRYILIRKLGEGGMGHVYLAQRNFEGIRQQVAIKILQRMDETSQQRFLQESRILAQLSHPNICNFIDADFLSDGRPFVVMEYTPGLSIIEYSIQNKLSISVRLQLFLQLCEAVSYAHQNLIIHRDLKPDNVLVTEKGRVKLIDFGISKIQQEDAIQTQTQMRVLTPAYASPEQMLGHPINVSSDVYSLGMILYELLSGERAYQMKSLQTLSHVRAFFKSTKIVKPSEKGNGTNYSKGIEIDVDTITLKAINFDPVHRYHSVSNLVDDIQRYKSNWPILAKKPSIKYRLRMFVKRNKFILGSLTVAFTVVFSFVMLIINQRNIAIREKEKSDILAQTFIQAFESADLTKTDGKLLSARDILEETKDLILKSSLDSLQKSQLLLSIIEVYRNLNIFDPIHELISVVESSYSQLSHDEKIRFRSEKSINFFREGRKEGQLLQEINSAITELGPDSRLMYTKAFLYRMMARYSVVIEEVGPYFEKLKEDDENYIPICSLYGYALASSRKYQKGLNVYQTCLKLIENQQSTKHNWEKSNLLFQLGRLNIDLKEYQKALDYFDQAKQARMDLFKEDNVSISDVDIYIADALVLSGKAAESLPFIENAIRGRTKHYPNNPWSLSKPLFSKSKAQFRLNNLEEAELSVLKAIELRQAAGVEISPNTALQYQHQGRIYFAQGKYKKSIRSYISAIEILSSDKYKSIYWAAETKVFLAQAYFYNQQYELAKSTVQKALPDMYTIHDETDEVRVILAELLLQLKIN